MGRKEPSEELDRALEHISRKTRDLRRHLRKAVVDHVSDSFLETNVPLLVLMEAARAGNEREVEEYAKVGVGGVRCRAGEMSWWNSGDDGTGCEQYGCLDMDKV